MNEKEPRSAAAFVITMDVELERAMDELEQTLAAALQEEAELAEFVALRHLWAAVAMRRRAREERKRAGARRRAAIASSSPLARRSSRRTISTRRSSN